MPFLSSAFSSPASSISSAQSSSSSIRKLSNANFRGVVESYDPDTQSGSILARTGNLYEVDRADLASSLDRKTIVAGLPVVFVPFYASDCCELRAQQVSVDWEKVICLARWLSSYSS